MIKAYKGDDRYAQPWQERFGVPFRKDGSTYGRVRLYTDRAIYRPGQTVYAGGLCFDTRLTEEWVVPAREVVLVLQDPNRKTVAEQTVKSDEYGTFSAAFTLPPTALSGDYVLKAGTRSMVLRVEEYKRPTFAVR